MRPLPVVCRTRSRRLSQSRRGGNTPDTVQGERPSIEEGPLVMVSDHPPGTSSPRAGSEAHSKPIKANGHIASMRYHNSSTIAPIQLSNNSTDTTPTTRSPDMTVIKSAGTQSPAAQVHFSTRSIDKVNRNNNQENGIEKFAISIVTIVLLTILAQVI